MGILRNDIKIPVSYQLLRGYPAAAQTGNIWQSQPLRGGVQGYTACRTKLKLGKGAGQSLDKGQPACGGGREKLQN